MTYQVVRFMRCLRDVSLAGGENLPELSTSTVRTSTEITQVPSVWPDFVLQEIRSNDQPKETGTRSDAHSTAVEEISEEWQQRKRIDFMLAPPESSSSASFLNMPAGYAWMLLSVELVANDENKPILGELLQVLRANTSPTKTNALPAVTAFWSSTQIAVQIAVKACDANGLSSDPAPLHVLGLCGIARMNTSRMGLCFSGTRASASHH